MIRFRSLGSGSTGNATLVEHHGSTRRSRVLVDCGFTARELTLRLTAADVAPEQLDAIFITHEHGDHIGCALTLSRRHAIPLWMSHGTWQALGTPACERLGIARDGVRITVGDLAIDPFTVPHDAREPLQLSLTDGAHKLGVLTDVGMSTPHLLAALGGCRALLLECNHDRGLLAASAYPASLKQRIGGRLGHLANDTAAQILAACVHDGLKHVVAAHLSQQNNDPARAAAALAGAVGGAATDVVVATAASGSPWMSLA